jgi:hypothetical protein
MGVNILWVVMLAVSITLVVVSNADQPLPTETPILEPIDQEDIIQVVAQPDQPDMESPPFDAKIDTQLPPQPPQRPISADNQRGFYDWLNRKTDKDWAAVPNRQQNYYNYYDEYPAGDVYNYYYYNYYYYDASKDDTPNNYYAWGNENADPNNDWNNWKADEELFRDPEPLPKPQPASAEPEDGGDIEKFRNRFLDGLQNFVPDQ